VGATWFGNQHAHLNSLLDELDIEYFQQAIDGKLFFQQFETSHAESIQISAKPSNYRIAGGSSNLINTLYQKLDSDDILLNQTVREIKSHENSFQVITKGVLEGDIAALSIFPKL
jgi:monoamine oxidase